MHPSSRRLDPRLDAAARPFLDERASIIDRRHVDPAGERRALVAGLLSMPASIEPKYFYDGAGCALFARICELPEYYPTRTEALIFERYREEIVGAAGTGKQLVDLGAGDCAKGAAWLPWLAPTRYVAVDIAGDTLAQAVPRIALAHPDVEVQGVLIDFTRGFDLRRDVAGAATTYFYPGSSIGNFSASEALQFLRAIHRHCERDAESGLLIGVDTKKDSARLRAAYDDPAGITAAFNRNILLHVNRVLGTSFAPAGFAHVALYNEAVGRIEIYLEARAPQTVPIDGMVRTYGTGERIHTENSYKYAPHEFTGMLQRAGFASVQCWQDDAGDFAVYYAS